MSHRLAQPLLPRRPAVARLTGPLRLVGVALLLGALDFDDILMSLALDQRYDLVSLPQQAISLFAAAGNLTWLACGLNLVIMIRPVEGWLAPFGAGRSARRSPGPAVTWTPFPVTEARLRFEECPLAIASARGSPPIT